MYFFCNYTREIIDCLKVNKSSVYARDQLKKLSNLGLLEWHGSSKNDPTQNYTFKKFK
nr:MAG TPA: hypothetical protein [Caudoviricetes sp.]